MSASKPTLLDRRRFLGSATLGLTAALAAPALAQDQSVYDPNSENHETTEYTNDRHNISSFRSLDWRPYFTDTTNGVILVDTVSRALHYWSEDQTMYKLYPTSVPLTAELTRKGRTEIIRKVEGPTWSPTPEMRKRNPNWPEFVPAGPDNPLGTHALYLSWHYYRIHGTHDTRKIGRKSSNGCVGLYNEHIQELYALTKVGTQVLLI